MDISFCTLQPAFAFFEICFHWMIVLFSSFRFLSVSRHYEIILRIISLSVLEYANRLFDLFHLEMDFSFTSHRDRHFSLSLSHRPATQASVTGKWLLLTHTVSEPHNWAALHYSLHSSGFSLSCISQRYFQVIRHASFLHCSHCLSLYTRQDCTLPTPHRCHAQEVSPLALFPGGFKSLRRPLASVLQGEASHRDERGHRRKERRNRDTAEMECETQQDNARASRSTGPLQCSPAGNVAYLPPTMPPPPPPLLREDKTMKQRISPAEIAQPLQAKRQENEWHRGRGKERISSLSLFTAQAQHCTAQHTAYFISMDTQTEWCFQVLQPIRNFTVCIS